MPAKYDHQTIEKKWQERWKKEKVFSVHQATTPAPLLEKEGAERTYILDMFPYPSGDGLHVGHPEGYTATDIYSRYLRMHGKTVLHPMGWDAFGLPAENAAIKKGVHPRIVTEQNIKNFKRQIQSIGFSYDWDREINTTDPKYYTWTQWIFLQLFKKGLAYEAELPIWWCPKDKTGLANEEVIDGRCERCGTVVERKLLRQWVLKITAYAERLLKGLDKLDWPESIKALQRNWIGRSEGAEVDFTIKTWDKVLVATNNPSKVARIKKLLASVPDAPQVVTPKDLHLEDQEVEEGSDLFENAKNKALAYRNQADLPILGTDTGIFVEGENIDPAKVRRNATGQENDLDLPQEEKAKMMIEYYSGIARKHGGKVDAYWKDVFVLSLPNGEIVTNESRRDVVFTTTVRKPVDPYFPMRSLYINKNTGKYPADETNDEEINVDLQPYKEALRKLLLSKVSIFTTRPDTLFGATYLVLSPEHPLVDEITTAEHKKAVEKYKKVVTSKSDLERTALEKEKTGVFTGAFAENPINKKQIPIWIADYVLMSYGTGAIMAVPAHDERDYAFSIKYTLPIRNVITTPKPLLEKEGADVAYTGEGKMTNSGQFNGMSSEEGRKKIVAWLGKEGKAKFKVNYKLRDWIFSRQRYWGEPIPLTHCENCKKTVESTPHYLNFYNQQTWDNLLSGSKTIETRALNPEEPNRYFGKIKAGQADSDSYIKGIFKPTGATAYFRVKSVRTYKSLKELFADKKTMAAVAPTKKHTNIKEFEAAYESLSPGYVEKINKNGLIAFEVKHVLPGIILVPEKELPLLLPDVEKYQPTGTGESPLAAVKDWVNVKCRVCGHPAKRETNTMPQWAGSCWYYIRFTDPDNDKAMASDKAMKTWLPVDLYVGGAEHAVLHLLYSRFWHLVLYDIGAIPKTNDKGESLEEPFTKLKNQGLILGPDGEKMSKSRGNVINPDDIIEKYGADTLRMYEMFMGPFEDAKPWDMNGIVGVRRFLDRVWLLKDKVDRDETGRTSTSHRCTAAVTKSIPSFQLNTCVSDLMKWSNEWKSAVSVPLGDVEVFIKLLSPFAPHIAEELWQQLGHETPLVQEPWPNFDPELLGEDTVTIAVQVNGKLRATLTMPSGTNQADIETAAKAETNVKKYLAGKPKKVIFVKDKLINFVI